ncbi:MAG: arylesterase [Pseudomonadota bacterium]
MTVNRSHPKPQADLLPWVKAARFLQSCQTVWGRVVWGLLAVFLVVSPVRGAWSQEVTLIAFGDSLTHGYGLPADTAFPDQLQAALDNAGEQAVVINAGNSGDTTAAGLARLDWALADLPKDKPAAMILELGANDSLRGLPPESTRDNLDKILAKVTGKNISVLLAGMLAPRNLGNDYAGKFDRVFPDLAEKYDVPLYAFFLEGVALDPTLNQADGIHPNEAGVAVIVERITPMVLQLLADARASAAGAGG